MSSAIRKENLTAASGLLKFLFSPFWLKPMLLHGLPEHSFPFRCSSYFQMRIGLVYLTALL